MSVLALLPDARPSSGGYDTTTITRQRASVTDHDRTLFTERTCMRIVTFTRSAELQWTGDVVRGSGSVVAGTGAFAILASFPTLRGEPPGTTTPEELLAASHAVCFGIGLRSVLARHGGSAAKVVVTATLTAEKGDGVIRIRRSHLAARIEGLEGVAVSALAEIGAIAKQECTISVAIGGTVEVSFEVASA